VPLSIQKSAAKNYATADSEIDNDGKVISALVSLLLLLLVFTETQRLFEQICESSYFTFDALNFLLIMSLYLSPFFVFYLFSQSGVVNLR
jgi:hypothetical protein